MKFAYEIKIKICLMNLSFQGQSFQCWLLTTVNYDKILLVLYQTKNKNKFKR